MKIKHIDGYGFSENRNLKSVHLPELTYIGGLAFKDCISLEHIFCPNVALSAAGTFTKTFDTGNLASGVYLLSILIDGNNVVKEIIVSK